MRYKVLKIIIVASFLTITCEGIGISSKLDFGDAHSSPKIVGTATQYRSVSTPLKHSKKEEIKTDFEGIGVVCVSGGCNATKTEKESKDSIEADVVVHVKTSVDLNKKNKTSFIDDTPDVPIIVGTAGISEDSQSRAFDQRPVLVSDFNTFTSPGPSFSPSVGPTISSSVTPSFVPSYSSTYNSPSLDTVYVHSPNIASEPRVDINIKTLPSVSLTMTEDGRSVKDIRYKANGLEVRYPYFEPSFHNHYFGESPPPQLSWYPKRSGVSTVDFKPKTSVWKPSLWSGGTATNTQHRHTVGNTCSCKYQPNTGLQWYPARKSYQDPGRQIDDKLADLN